MPDIRVPCRECHQTIPWPDLPGVRQPFCPLCSAENTVPIPGRLLAIDLFFACGHCEQRLAAGDEAQGLSIECPLCAEMTVVPTLSGKSESGSSNHPTGDLTGEEVAFLSGPFSA